MSDAGPGLAGLSDVLAAREARARRQDELAATFLVGPEAAPGVTVVGVTVVAPGPIKDARWSRRVHAAGMSAVEEVAAARGWPVRHRETDPPGPAGPCGYVVLAAEAPTVKAELTAAEDSHPVGRLWDLDVVADGRPLGRADLRLPPRRCLVCSGPAAPCARSRAHDLHELTRRIDELVAAWDAGAR